MTGYAFDDSCDLCEAARITPWFHEDDICWIAECEICAVPMVVWRGHGTDPPATELEHMHTQLAEVVTGRRVKAVTDVPVLLGVGISTPEQAAEASGAADGVVVGSALIARVLDGEGPEGAHALIAALPIDVSCPEVNATPPRSRWYTICG